ncbi:MAG: S24 family peptidase [Bacteroidales bacterium]
MSIHERLQKFIDTTDGSIAKFLREVGLSKAFMQKMEVNPNSISSVSLLKIKNVYPDLNIEWLMTGRLPMLLSDEQNNVSHEWVCFDDYIEVKATGVEAAAGYGAYNGSHSICDDPPIYIPREMAKSGSGNYIRIKMIGNSMEPTLREGAILIVRMIYPCDYMSIRTNDVYVVATREDQTYVKRVVNELNGSGCLILMSDNPDRDTYPDIIVFATDVLSIWRVEYYISDNLENMHQDHSQDILFLRKEVAMIRQLMKNKKDGF